MNFTLLGEYNLGKSRRRRPTVIAMAGRRIWTVGLFILGVLLFLAGCGRETTTPTPIPTPAGTRFPTPLPFQTPPPGLPPAVSLLPRDAWLALRVETPDGKRWTLIAYGDRDEILDEAGNRRWVDRGSFVSRQAHMWRALLRQAGFAHLSKDAYWTTCDLCPALALAVRAEDGTSFRGVWLHLRPYDAVAEVLPLLPVANALRLMAESVMMTHAPGEVMTMPSLPTEGDIPDDPLRVFYGEALHMTTNGPRVGKTVHPWVMQVVPGAFTKPDAVQAVALVGGTAPDENVSDEDMPYLPARLVVFEHGKEGWHVVTEAPGIASNMPVDRLPAGILQVSDFDRNGVQEILLSVASLIPGYLDGVYHLYRWDGETLRRVWMTTSLYDNTTLADQPDFATQVTWPHWEDTDGDGVDEIVLKVVRRAYERSEVGIADTARVHSLTTDDVIFDWDGKGFRLLSP